jgi:hypothetical protein
VIQAAHAPMSGGTDFSACGVKRRFDSGGAAGGEPSGSADVMASACGDRMTCAALTGATILSSLFYLRSNRFPLDARG